MRTIHLQSVNMKEAIYELLPLKEMIRVVFDTGEVLDLPVRKVIFHLVFWNIARKWGVIITPDLVVDTTNVNSKTISTLGTLILDQVRKIHASYHDVVFDFNDAMNTLNKFTIDHCQEYHKALSILDLARISQIPEIQAICAEKITDNQLPTKEADKFMRKTTERLFAELKKPHPMNNIHDFINLRFVNETQLAHIFYQIGFRTDIDDTVVRYPIRGNYLDGLNDYVEYCLEALSAKKSAFYNKDSLPIAEYFGRRQHILLSCIKHMHPGDCGTPLTVPVTITKALKDMYLYKNIIDNSQLITLTPENIHRYIGIMVNMRSPMVCRYQDGICEACGGKLLGSITPNTHIGMFSAIQTTSVITQVILSAKHVQRTNTLDYTIPTELSGILFKIKGRIFVKPKVVDKFKEATLVFSIRDAIHLMGLQEFNLNRLSAINESSFGICRDLVILKGNTPMTDQVSLEVNGQYPLYSRHLIKYIASHPDNVFIRDDLFCIRMKDFDMANPIFKLMTMNNSMVKFVTRAKKLLETTLQNYHSIPELLNDFADLVYDQVKINIVYLEVVLRAAMVTDDFDFRLPVVADIDNVQFKCNRMVNMMRSLGVLCAFEQSPKAFENPVMFLQPKLYSPFDEFLNLKPRRDQLT